MAADPQRLADTRDWLLKAAQDLKAAETLLAADEPLAGSAAFHAQQAAEKSLKAFLHWHDQPFGKTHELEELGRACMAIDGSLAPAVEEIVDLTPFAWRFRYPGEPLEPEVPEVEAALERARRAHAAVGERLPDEARPG